MLHERRVIFRIAQQTRDVAHENQAACFESDRGLGRGDVSVAIVNLADLVTRGRADHRRNVAINAFPQWLRLHPEHFADKSEIVRNGGRTSCAARLAGARPSSSEFEFAAAEDVGAGKAARFSTELRDRANDFWIN